MEVSASANPKQHVHPKPCHVASDKVVDAFSLFKPAPKQQPVVVLQRVDCPAGATLVSTSLPATTTSGPDVFDVMRIVT